MASQTYSMFGKHKFRELYDSIQVYTIYKLEIGSRYGVVSNGRSGVGMIKINQANSLMRGNKRVAFLDGVWASQSQIQNNLIEFALGAFESR